MLRLYSRPREHSTRIGTELKLMPEQMLKAQEIERERWFIDKILNHFAARS